MVTYNNVNGCTLILCKGDKVTFYLPESILFPQVFATFEQSFFEKN